MGKLLICLQKYQRKHSWLGCYGTVLCLQSTLQSLKEQSWGNIKIRGNISPALTNVSFAQNCSPSLPVLLWNSYKYPVAKHKTSPSLFPGAGQYPVFQPSTQQLLLCSRRTVASAVDQGSYWWPLGPTSPASHWEGQRQALAKLIQHCGQSKASVTGDTMHPDLPVNYHHCLGSPATLHLLLYWGFFFVLEQQGAYHSNWFHGRTPGSGLNSSWEEDSQEFLQVWRVGFNQTLKD